MAKTLLGRPLLRKDVEIAYAHSRSAAEAARYLSVSYPTFKKYAKMYGMFTTNKAGKGIPRPRMQGSTSLKEILEGKHPNYPLKRLRERIIRAGIVAHECAMCGYHDVRSDGRGPYTLYPIDGDRRNLKLENLELRCYNCIFVTTGRVDPNLLTLGPYVYKKDIEEVSGLQDVDMDALREEIQNELEKEKDKSSS